jgi:hypothetical protein
LYPTSSDLEGRQREIDGTLDMGAYEYDSGPYANASGRGDPNLAYDPVNNRYLAVYGYSDGTGGGWLYGRLINPDGTPYADQFQISEQKSYQRMFSAAAYDAFHQKYVAVWDTFNASSNDYDLMGQWVNPDGSLDGYNFTVSNKDAVKEWKSAIAHGGSNSQTLVVWNKQDYPTNQEDVFGRLFIKDVAQGTDEFPVANAAGSFQGNPAVAFDGVNNQFLVVWGDDRDSGYGSEIYGRRFDLSGAPIGNEIRVTDHGGSPQNGDQVDPAVAFNPTTQKFLVAWADTRHGNYDLYGRAVHSDGTMPGSSFPITTFAENQNCPTLDYNATMGKFLAVWQDERNGPATTNRDLYGQWLDGNGTTIGPNFAAVRVNEDQVFPRLASGASSFLAVFEIDYASGTPMFDVGFKEIKESSFLFLPLILRQ